MNKMGQEIRGEIKELVDKIKKFPLTYKVVSYITEKTSLLNKTMFVLFKDQNYPTFCENHIRYLTKMKRFISLHNVLDDFVLATKKYSLDCPMEYLRTKRFGAKDFKEAKKLVYDNKEAMESYYLNGLYLALIFWQGYAKIFQFFNRELNLLKENKGKVLEIGYGHGAYLLNLIKLNNNFQGVGVDISQFSKLYADDLREAMGIASSQVTFLNLDFYDFPESEQYDVLIACEILEHMEDPNKFLQKCKKLMKDKCLLFISIPIKSPAEDHLQFFNTWEEIEVVFRKNGFIIEKSYKEKTKNFLAVMLVS